MKSSFRRWNRWLLALLSPGLAIHAFDLRTGDSGRYIVKWYDESIVLDIHLKQHGTLPGSNNNETVAFLEAMDIWNAQLETFEMRGNIQPPKSDADRNDRNEIVEAFSYRGQQLGSSTIAVTFIYRRNPDVVDEVDIVFNNQETWDDYRGPLQENGDMDIRRVALHELGHLLSLLHPDDAGQSVEAIMNSTVSNRDALAFDDIAGAQTAFGVPGFVEPNDAFAGAIQIPDQLSGTWFDEATNVNASREAGEPAHVEVGKGKSLWWRWSPSVDRHLKLRTFGSDFDTTMAVYRGTGLTNLVLVEENDDEETTDDNPNIDRIRTSLISFNATAGENYFIAVDGWGPGPDFVPTLHGEVDLTVTFDEPWVATSISRHPTEAVVTPGAIARLVVEATGYPELVYRWQRLPAGGAWEFIDGSAPGYRGLGTNTLEVDASDGRDGDQYRCVLVNEAGQTISQPALLRFDAASLPEFRSPVADVSLILTDDSILRVDASNYTSLQWFRDGNAIAGANALALDLGDLNQFVDGTYRVVLTGPNGQVSSGDFQVAVDRGALMNLVNLSVRSTAAEGAATLVVGFAVSGQDAQPLILRGVGPSLAGFGVTGFAVNPRVTLYDGSQTQIDFNDDWTDSPEVVEAFNTVGAFALVSGSEDAVLFRSIDPGAYSAHVTPGDAEAGIVVVEAYDAKGDAELDAQLSNLSARTEVGTGAEVLIAGFVLEGPGEKRLLIRAIAPELAEFGLPAESLLTDPLLEIRRGDEVVASNNDWGGSDELKSAFGEVGAFTLTDDASRDAVLIVTLPAGVYTATVSGADGGTGVALVEVYELP